MQGKLHGGGTALVTDSGIGPVFKKSANGTGATSADGQVQWSSAVHILRVRIRAGSDKPDDRRGLCWWIPMGRTRTSECGRMQRFCSTPVPGSHIRSSVDQPVYHCEPVGGSGEVQCRVAGIGVAPDLLDKVRVGLLAGCSLEELRRRKSRRLIQQLRKKRVIVRDNGVHQLSQRLL